jgi:hypothetical protein
MNSLWISIARNVRNKGAARGARFHARSHPADPQVFPAVAGLQVDVHEAVFPILGQLDQLY